MRDSKGYTLMEIVVVLVIIGVIAGFYFPRFTVPSEKAWAANAQNNLLAIYSAEQNYNNNNNGYCYSTSSASSACATSTGDSHCGDSLPAINCNLSLNIQDDGTYTYACSLSTGVYTCKATRATVSSTNIVVTLNNLAINLSGSGTANPQCNTSNNYCP